MNREITINETTIDDESPAYVIAEIGHNHQGSVEQCMQMFDKVKDSGANAVKLQKRNNKAIFTKEAYNKVYDNRNSYGETYGEHREFLQEFDEKQFQDLIQYASELGITFFSTAFDEESADMLDGLGTVAFKVASFDLTHTPLLRHISKKGKPIVLSTGGASMDDIERGYEAVREFNDQVAILQCTSSYPCAFEELDLNVIKTLREKFSEAPIGYSGHDSGIAMSVAAYVLGARIIEKHFTLNRASKGTDHAFSLEPIGLSKMCRDLERCRVALGNGIKKVYPSEVKPRTKMAKKIVAVRDLPAGATLAFDDLAFKSPGDGMPPWRYEELLGRKLKHSMAEEEAFHLECIE